MTGNTQPEALRLANLCSNLARYSMDAHLIAAELRRLHARIAELEAQLEAVGAGGVKAWAVVDAQKLREGFTAADMATATAQGFRDGVASIAANAEGPAVNRATVIEWLDANDIEVTDRQLGGLFHFSAPPTSAEVLGHERPEWSSSYGRADALNDVQERMTALHKPAVDKAWGQFQSAMAAPQPAPAPLSECLRLLNSFEYEGDEDSQAKAFFKAHINEDWFFHVKNSLELALAAQGGKV